MKPFASIWHSINMLLLISYQNVIESNHYQCNHPNNLMLTTLEGVPRFLFFLGTYDSTVDFP